MDEPTSRVTQIKAQKSKRLFGIEKFAISNIIFLAAQSG